MLKLHNLIFPFALVAATLTLGSAAQADLITAITTTEGFVSFEGGAQTVTDFTAGMDFTVTATAISKSGDLGNNRLWGLGSTDPVTLQAAHSDARLDTGGLNTGNGPAAFDDSYQFAAGTFADTDSVFIFINGANDNFLTDAAVYDSAGNQLGSTVNLSTAIGSGDEFGRLDFARDGGSGELANRRLYGYVVDISEFGVADASLIDSVSFGAPIAADFLLVGAATAAVPEPGSLMIIGTLAIGFVARRRRK